MNQRIKEPRGRSGVIIRLGAFWLLLWGLGTACTAGTLWQTSFAFSTNWDAGWDYAVFVVGAADELGNWKPEQAVRLTWTSGNIWTGHVALPAGVRHEFKYIRRNMASDQYCETTNVTWAAGANLAVTAAPPPTASGAGKTVYYHSGWTNAEIVYRCGSTQWLGAAMTRVGPGRSADEYLYTVSGIGTNDLELFFVFNGMSNGVQHWDNAPYEGPGAGEYNYYTHLDAFWVQDKQVFNYQPPASVGAPYIVERWVDSTVDGITGRTIRIWLPRGYHETGRRYPVLYMHDGQELFCGDIPRDDQWNADWHATREISQGRMRECIIVGMDNTTSRQWEYEPPSDTYYTGYPAGIGDKYLKHFADNVRPTLDVNYRTLTSPGNTFIGGSSMGGLISIYFGYETNLFGGVLAMSPAITRATNYTEALRGKTRRNLLIYLDTGSAEGSVGPGGGDYWSKPWEAYAIFLQQGYAPNRDLLMRIGCGAGHNEAAWSARYTPAVRFLLDPRREPNLPLQQERPPRIGGDAGADGTPRWTVPTISGFGYVLEYRPDLLAGGWQTNTVSGVETNPWGWAMFPGALTAGFYRAKASGAN